MSDSDSEGENIPLTKTGTSNTGNSSDCSISAAEEYRVEQIERLLKTSADSKHYIVIKNSSVLVKSDAWQKFGFPSKITVDGKNHVAIPGFVSCFQCFKTFLYKGSTKYLIKHSCSNANRASHGEIGRATGAIDKYVKKKAVISSQEKEKMTEKIVAWVCSSIRPFTIIEDPGFIDVLSEGIRIGM